MIESGEYITSGSQSFHRNCFRCTACHELINYKVRYEENLPYHPECAKELFNPHCCLCCRAMEGVYSKHPFFSDEVYCFEHSKAEPPLKTCFSCGRKEPLPISRKEGFVDLSDGRSLCPRCSSTIIVDSSEASLIYKQILSFFEEHLQFTIPAAMRTVPVLAVDVHAMNENKDNSVSGNHGTGSAITRGLTLSTIGTIRHFNRGFFKSIKQELYRIEEVRDVTAVLVLFGLPYNLFSSILAHEATHVWLKLTKSIPYDLPPEVEEGICQLIAYKYLEFISRSEQMSINPLDAKIETESQYFLYQIENDESTIYGEGFRMAKHVDSELGLEILLDFVSKNKSFPLL